MPAMQAMRKVRVIGGNLKFSSAHFITYGEGGKCERLHGHNYGVLVEIDGMLGTDGLVFDFSLLKRRTQEICRQLDHRFLLPLHNPHLELLSASDGWEIRFADKRYFFPLDDVVALPIANSTAELIAEYICGELCRVLVEYDTSNLYTLLVGVEEAPTQMAYCSVSLHE